MRAMEAIRAGRFLTNSRADLLQAEIAGVRTVSTGELAVEEGRVLTEVFLFFKANPRVSKGQGLSLIHI